MRIFPSLAAAIAPFLFSGPVLAQDEVPTPDEINAAAYDGGGLPEGRSALTVKLQVLLDRAGISPGIIDGYKGGMSESALRAFETREGYEVDGLLDMEVWQALGGPEAGAVVAEYTISEDDADRLNPPLPDDYAELAEMDWLGYASVAESLAERFHMDEEFLEGLNPDAEFAVGDPVVVAQPGDELSAEITRVEVDKASQRLAAFNAAGEMIANYPVTVGSQQLPSPSGTHEVQAIALPASYTYQPDENFQQGDNDEGLVLPPGPNNPVGIVWIDINKPTYGIHGTSEPAELFQTQSHGCVRMTNWDARELAHMVSEGTTVVFNEG
ncbi:murein L,D-transpeptidase [Devosia pacifica]|uniref:Murein L,D-transpeptidase n=1 Tax=Devosia pacifica TaxID=1335967 RepID=A0A918RXQ8_9HYPH|nr:L,D-transpeptidase [Devosia pacifica]GHA16411.1 murein L,D-transpeptidase [Devosia pacifica]